LIGIAVPALLLSATVHQLQHAATVARSLVGSVLRAQDEERRRIARDIHDTTAQNLIAAALLVDGVIASAEPACAKARTVKDLINQSVRELQTVSYLLHPPLLDQGGLGEALPPYIRGFSERSGIAVTLRMRPDFPRLPIDIELVIYRVVQEALSNIARHSGSETARVQIYRVGTQPKVHVSVTDFGIGIPDRSEHHHAHLRLGGAGIGLDSMRERVEQVGGGLRVQSAPGRTRVTAVIPVGE
jgi:signal transduction histidine kinase